jgi:hypothetical protein
MYNNSTPVFAPYPCVAIDNYEWTKQQAWNDHHSWKANELSWDELDAMADAAVEWEVRCA